MHGFGAWNLCGDIVAVRLIGGLETAALDAPFLPIILIGGLESVLAAIFVANLPSNAGSANSCDHRCGNFG